MKSTILHSQFYFRFERSHYIIEKHTRINYTETFFKISSRIFIFSSQAKHNLSVKTQFHRLVLSKFYHLYCRAVLRSYSVSIYRFKRDNFLSENVIFESKTCIQNGQYFERRLDLTSCECDDRRVERLVPPSLPNENAEDC